MIYPDIQGSEEMTTILNMIPEKLQRGEVVEATKELVEGKGACLAVGTQVSCQACRELVVPLCVLFKEVSDTI